MRQSGRFGFKSLAHWSLFARIVSQWRQGLPFISVSDGLRFSKLRSPALHRRDVSVVIVVVVVVVVVVFVPVDIDATSFLIFLPILFLFPNCPPPSFPFFRCFFSLLSFSPFLLPFFPSLSQNLFFSFSPLSDFFFSPCLKYFLFSFLLTF